MYLVSFLKKKMKIENYEFNVLNCFSFIQKIGREQIFKNTFQGIFSDQKICKDCPHRLVLRPWKALSLSLTFCLTSYSLVTNHFKEHSHSLFFFPFFSVRYEREETFMALNLGVTSCQSLEISLDQFVRGEVLEGSNAYYCEKCKEKVNASSNCVLKFMNGLIVL